MSKKTNQKKKLKKNEQKNCDFSIILRECTYLIPCTHTCSWVHTKKNVQYLIWLLYLMAKQQQNEEKISLTNVKKNEANRNEP